MHKLKLKAQDHLYFDGEKSGYNSVIISSNQDDYIFCHGAGSCQNSVIYNASHVYAFSYLSLSNSIIHGTNRSNDDTHVILYGESSGRNLVFICYFSNYCELICFGNTCNDDQNITYLCIHDNGTHTDINDVDCYNHITFNCYSTKNNRICSNATSINYDKVVDDASTFFGLSLSFVSPNISVSFEKINTYENSVGICEFDSYMCDNYQDCYSDTIAQDITGPVCCVGGSSCGEV